MRRRSVRGVTLLETLVALVLLGFVAAISGATLQSARRDDRVAEDYAGDLRRLRAGLDAVSAAVRAGHTVDVGKDRLIVDGVAWHVRDAALLRGDDVVARRVVRLEAVREPDGVVRVGIAPVPRVAGATSPTLVTRVAPRAGGSR